MTGTPLALSPGMMLLLALLQCHGTAIEWEESVVEARRRAQREDKLLLLLHVSGEFDKPDFT